MVDEKNCIGKIRKKTMKTEHLLYIYANTQYDCSEGDSAEFNKALKTLNEKIKNPSPQGTLDGENYLGAYISGMYPEFEKAVVFFQEEVGKYMHSNCKMTDILMKSKAISTIKKFGLKREYNFDCEPNAEQQHRINALIRPKQKNDLTKYAPEFLKDVGVALMECSKDYLPVHSFIDKIKVITNTVSGKYPEKLVRENQDVDGAKEALEFLSLKKQGLINDNLQITDIDGFCNSEIVKNFPINGKVYDLSKNLRKLHTPQPSNNLSKAAELQK